MEMTVIEAQLAIQDARRGVFAGMSYQDAGKKYKDVVNTLNKAATEVARRHGKGPKHFSLKQLIEAPGLF
jgi:hypothetical protein